MLSNKPYFISSNLQGFYTFRGGLTGQMCELCNSFTK